MHALHFREVIARSWPAVPAGTSEIEEVELQNSFRLRSGDCDYIPKENRTDKCQPSWRVRGVARHPGPVATVGPAYPQDEPGRGTCDGGIVPEQILLSTRNLNSGWNTNQNVLAPVTNARALS